MSPVRVLEAQTATSMLRREFIGACFGTAFAPVQPLVFELEAIAAETLPHRRPLPPGQRRHGIFEFRRYENGASGWHWFGSLAEREQAWSSAPSTPSRPIEISLYRVASAR